MKKQIISKDDNVLFDNFVKEGRRISPSAPNNIENSVMRRIRETESENKISMLARLHLPSMRVLASLSSFILILFFAILFFTAVPQPQAGYRTISFRFKDSSASRVCLVGDFNSWKKNSDCLLKADGYWHISKQLKTGQFYKYAFLVNNKKIVSDVKASQFVEDGFGGKTAVVYVN